MRWRHLGLGVWLSLIAVTIYGSLAHPAQVSANLASQDKLMHGLVYGLMMFWFVQLTLRHRTNWLGALFLLCLGGSLELLQSLSPVRQAELADLLANTVGIALALGLSYTPLGRLGFALAARFTSAHGQSVSRRVKGAGVTQEPPTS